MLVKFGIGGDHKNVKSNSDFRENWHSENRRLVLLRDESELIFINSTCFTELGDIKCKKFARSAIKHLKVA